MTTKRRLSPINFATLERDRPDLKSAWDSLRKWFQKYQSSQFTDIDSLRKATDDVNLVLLVQALDWMVKSGMMVRKLKLRSPKGYMLSGEWDTLAEIPESVEDRLDDLDIDTAYLEIIPGFRWERSDAPDKQSRFRPVTPTGV